MGDSIAKQGNHNQPLVCTLKHTNPNTGVREKYVIPDGSTARIKITRDGDSALLVDAPVTILDQAGNPGKVSYLMQGSFTDLVSDYDVEIKLTLPDGSVRLFPGNEDETFSTLRVLPSKGGI